MKMKKQLLALLLAAVMVLSLTGCKETPEKGSAEGDRPPEEVQEEDTTRWAEATTDPLIIQGIADASAKYATATADGCLYAVFNGIWSRSTGYFTAPTGSLNIMACGTAEGTQKFGGTVEKRWTAAQSMCRTAPIISRPMAPTTAAPFPAGPGGAVPRDHLV